MERIKHAFIGLFSFIFLFTQNVSVSKASEVSLMNQLQNIEDGRKSLQLGGSRGSATPGDLIVQIDQEILLLKDDAVSVKETRKRLKAKLLEAKKEKELHTENFILSLSATETNALLKARNQNQLTLIDLSAKQELLLNEAKSEIYSEFKNEIQFINKSSKAEVINRFENYREGILAKGNGAKVFLVTLLLFVLVVAVYHLACIKRDLEYTLPLVVEYPDGTFGAAACDTWRTINDCNKTIVKSFNYDCDCPDGCEPVL